MSLDPYANSALNSTPSLCGVDGGSLTREDMIRLLCKRTAEKYPMFRPFLKEGSNEGIGLALHEVDTSIRCIALFMSHNLEKRQPGGGTVIYVCHTNPFPRSRRRHGKRRRSRKKGKGKGKDKGKSKSRDKNQTSCKDKGEGEGQDKGKEHDKDNCSDTDCDCDCDRTSSDQSETETETESDRNSEIDKEAANSLCQPSCAHVHCPFRLRFQKQKDGLYYFDIKNKENTVTKICDSCTWPPICNSLSFLDVFLSTFKPLDMETVRNCNLSAFVNTIFSIYGINCSPTMKASLMASLEKRSLKLLLESDQRLQSYMQYLNRNGHYGVVYYSNKDLAVPGEDMQFEIKSCDPIHFQLPGPRMLNRDHYWDGFLQSNSKGGEKNVDMAFQAVKPAVQAFQYSIPVICLDAAFIKKALKRTLLLTATFQTTDGHLLTMWGI